MTTGIGRTVVVAGPPGAGKSSALRLICEGNVGVTHFAVRDFAMRLLEERSPCALANEKKIRQRHVLPDHAVGSMLSLFLHRFSDADRLIIEGYPRTWTQCMDLMTIITDAGARALHVVMIRVDDHVVRERVRHRKLCTCCARSSEPGQQDSICRTCGEVMVRRSDDSADSFERRLADYRHTEVLLTDYFTRRVPLFEIDGNLPPTEISARINDALG